MTIANSTDGIWVNDDTLRVKYGRAEAVKGNAGEFNMPSSTHVSEIDVNFTGVALGTGATVVYIHDYDTVFPDTAIVEKIEFVTGTAWATDTDISFGIVKRSDFTTIHDADGLVAALILAARNVAGETTVILPGGTYAGALMGVQAGIGFDGVVCSFWTGAAPTAGTGTLRIYWRNGPVTVS